MTILEIVEEIQERFPDVTIPQCIRKMSVAQQEFCAVTHCLVGPYLVDIADFVDGMWQIDPNIDLVRSAALLDVNGEVVETDFLVNVSEHVVRLYNTDGTAMKTFPSSVDSVRLQCSMLPDDIAETDAALSEIPAVHQRFHKALLWGPLIELGLLKSRADVAQLAQLSFNKLVIEGKKYANLEGNDIYDVQGRIHYVASDSLSHLDYSDE